ncbi:MULTISPECIES: hypothetical protein [Methylotenera]|nr:MULTISPECIES: hypothetical protein [Methylotenera]
MAEAENTGMARKQKICTVSEDLVGRLDNSDAENAGVFLVGY